MLLLSAGAAFHASAAPAGPAAQPFDAVDKPERIDPQWRTGLCALMPQPCEAASLQLLRPRAAGADAHVVLSTQPLAMVRATYVPGAGWKLDTLHDFRGYRHSMADPKTDNGATAPPPLSLAPALYPLAVGLLQREGIQDLAALPRREHRQPAHRLRGAVEAGRRLRLVVHLAPERLGSAQAGARRAHQRGPLHRSRWRCRAVLRRTAVAAGLQPMTAASSACM